MWRKDVAPFRPIFFLLGTLKIQRCKFLFLRIGGGIQRNLMRMKIQRCKFLFLHIGGGIQRNLMRMTSCFMLQTVLEGWWPYLLC